MLVGKEKFLAGISVAGEDGCILSTPETRKKKTETGLRNGRILCSWFYLYLGMILLLENSSKNPAINFLPGRWPFLN